MASGPRFGVMHLFPPKGTENLIMIRGRLARVTDDNFCGTWMRAGSMAKPTVQALASWPLAVRLQRLQTSVWYSTSPPALKEKELKTNTEDITEKLAVWNCQSNNIQSTSTAGVSVCESCSRRLRSQHKQPAGGGQDKQGAGEEGSHSTRSKSNGDYRYGFCSMSHTSRGLYVLRAGPQARLVASHGVWQRRSPHLRAANSPCRTMAAAR
jgi:hypothetical protein